MNRAPASNFFFHFLFFGYEIKKENQENLFDVTGGMRRKITESIEIAKSGTPSYLINGFHPERILDIVHDRKYIGTCIRMGSGS